MSSSTASFFNSVFISRNFLMLCSAVGGATIFYFLQKITEKLKEKKDCAFSLLDNKIHEAECNEEQEEVHENNQKLKDVEKQNVSDDNEYESEAQSLTDIPENAPESCPGVQSQLAGKSASCEGCPNKQICSSGEARNRGSSVPPEISNNLSEIKHKILVLSGKGGVGKSTVSSQLALGLSEYGYHVGLLDVDICGPSIPRMTHTHGCDVHQSREGWQPIYIHNDRLAVMSIGFLLPNEDDAVIWRGPKKNGLIKQFLTDVTWGKLDFLIIDTPPGTSDEHLGIVTYLKNASIDGAIVVTTPQEISLQDVRKEINFCKKVEIKVLGVVENMSNSIFVASSGGAKAMCEKMGVPYALSIPLDSSLMRACEEGCSIMEVYGQSEAAEKISDLISYVLNVLNIDFKGLACKSENNSLDSYTNDEYININSKTHQNEEDNSSCISREEEDVKDIIKTEEILNNDQAVLCAQEEKDTPLNSKLEVEISNSNNNKETATRATPVVTESQNNTSKKKKKHNSAHVNSNNNKRIQDNTSCQTHLEGKHSLQPETREILCSSNAKNNKKRTNKHDIFTHTAENSKCKKV